MKKLNQKKIKKQLAKVIDPEIGIDIVSLGFIQDIQITDDGKVRVKYILTNPACPLGNLIHQEIRQTLLELVDGNQDLIEVNQLFDPPWNPEMMSEEARTKFGL